MSGSAPGRRLSVVAVPAVSVLGCAAIFALGLGGGRTLPTKTVADSSPVTRPVQAEPTAGPRPRPSETTAAPKSPHPQTDNLDGFDLWRAFQGDADKARKRYVGRTLRVSGWATYTPGDGGAGTLRFIRQKATLVSTSISAEHAVEFSRLYGPKSSGGKVVLVDGVCKGAGGDGVVLLEGGSLAGAPEPR
jgi:hypothetical protein